MFGGLGDLNPNCCCVLHLPSTCVGPSHSRASRMSHGLRSSCSCSSCTPAHCQTAVPVVSIQYPRGHATQMRHGARGPAPVPSSHQALAAASGGASLRGHGDTAAPASAASSHFGGQYGPPVQSQVEVAVLVAADLDVVAHLLLARKQGWHHGRADELLVLFSIHLVFQRGIRLCNPLGVSWARCRARLSTYA